jgi:hypothetical protein
VVQEDVFRQGHAEGLEDAVFEVATAAHDHLLTARSMLKSVPPSAMPVLISAVSAIMQVEVETHVLMAFLLATNHSGTHCQILGKIGTEQFQRV